MSINRCELKRPERGVIGPRVNMASKLLRNRFNKVAGEEGLFSGQHHIIITLRHEEGITLSRLAEILGITPATASVSVKRMEKAGFIEKKPDENDARTIRLYLTEKGEAATENIKKKMAFQESDITSELCDEEKLLLSDMLDKIIDNMIKEDCCNG